FDRSFVWIHTEQHSQCPDKVRSEFLSVSHRVNLLHVSCGYRVAVVIFSYDFFRVELCVVLGGICTVVVIVSMGWLRFDMKKRGNVFWDEWGFAVTVTLVCHQRFESCKNWRGSVH